MHYINILTKFQRLLVLHLIHGSLHSEKQISNVRKKRLDNIGIAHHASYIMQHVIIEFGHFSSSLAKRTFRCIGSSLNIELLSIDRILAVSHRTSLASVRCWLSNHTPTILGVRLKFPFHGKRRMRISQAFRAGNDTFSFGFPYDFCLSWGRQA